MFQKNVLDIYNFAQYLSQGITGLFILGARQLAACVIGLELKLVRRMIESLMHFSRNACRA